MPGMNDASTLTGPDPGRAAPLREGIFLFREADAKAVAETLATIGFAARPYAMAPASSFWVYPATGEPALRLHLIQSIPEFEIDLALETYLSWWRPLKAALGGEPASALRIEVSEGEAAAHTAAQVAAALLERHAGIAQDDNSPHAWTLDEIRAGAAVEGRRFFQPGGKGPVPS